MNKKFLEFIALHIRQILVVARITHFDIIIQKSKTRYAMDISVDYTYLRAYLRVGKEPKEQFRNGNELAVIETLCHEMSHIITGIPCHKSDDDFEEEEEQATELVARILYRLYLTETKEMR